jgi:hypothetical protein
MWVEFPFIIKAFTKQNISIKINAVFQRILKRILKYFVEKLTNVRGSIEWIN